MVILEPEIRSHISYPSNILMYLNIAYSIISPLTYSNLLDSVSIYFNMACMNLLLIKLYTAG